MHLASEDVIRNLLWVHENKFVSQTRGYDVR
jgi:hypothetical protein